MDRAKARLNPSIAYRNYIVLARMAIVLYCAVLPGMLCHGQEKEKRKAEAHALPFGSSQHLLKGGHLGSSIYLSPILSSLGGCGMDVALASCKAKTAQAAPAS